MKTIRKGDAGSDVVVWQKVLVAGSRPDKWTNVAGKQRQWPAEWSWPINADGIFGERTEAATEAWQFGRGLVADGIVGPRTWDAAGAVTEATAPTEVRANVVGGIEFVEARNFTRGRRQAVRLIVIHTMENAEMHNAARSAASWFATQPKRGTLVDSRLRPDPTGRPWGGSSVHYNVDANEIVQSVGDSDTAWHAGAVNDYSIGIEHGGSAKQSAADWEDDFSKRTLARSAALAAELCTRYRIAPVRLTAEDLKRGAKDGFCGHVDSTIAFGPVGGHWDPGPNFPWETYLALVKQELQRIQAAGAIAPPAVAGAAADDASWVKVVHAGKEWLVAPDYVGPIGIGEAEDLARRRGCILPTPELVDAIYQHADLKLDAWKLRRTDFTHWTMAEMAAPAVIADQLERIRAEVAARPFTLLAGSFKDVVRHTDGRVGLYGWHRADGTPIQPFYAGHAATWKDYSQGLRLVKAV